MPRETNLSIIVGGNDAVRVAGEDDVLNQGASRRAASEALGIPSDGSVRLGDWESRRVWNGRFLEKILRDAGTYSCTSGHLSRRLGDPPLVIRHQGGGSLDHDLGSSIPLTTSTADSS